MIDHHDRLYLGLFLDRVHGFTCRRRSSNSLDIISIDALRYVGYNVLVHSFLDLVVDYLDRGLDLCPHHYLDHDSRWFTCYSDPQTLFLDS